MRPPWPRRASGARRTQPDRGDRPHPVRPGGEPCVCGATGCAEAYASAATVARRHTATTGSHTDAAQVARLAAGGDAAARAVRDDAVSALADVLLITCAMLDPSLIVLGGGLAESGDLLLTPLRAREERDLAVSAVATVPYQRPTEVPLSACLWCGWQVEATRVARRGALLASSPVGLCEQCLSLGWTDDLQYQGSAEVWPWRAVRELRAVLPEEPFHSSGCALCGRTDAVARPWCPGDAVVPSTNPADQLDAEGASHGADSR
ncbi:ROK family protein [Streptomyces sp. NPDC005706]|uniref:ROK family protein n=1 Tax=Streptomyces sp. NPDC005706 TaxID=3157169 RepID=UPI0033DE407C